MPRDRPAFESRLMQTFDLPFLPLITLQQTVRVIKEVDQIFLIQLTNQNYESILVMHTVMHTGEADKEPSSINASLIEVSPGMRWCPV